MAGSSALVFTGVAGFVLVAATLIGLAVYLHRESSRDIREARQRVRFVNQVSHELRTPLTNIRLYAELLEQRLVDDDARTAEQLAVIVSESHRLSRLIGNVLSFARHQRGRLALQLTPSVLDDSVAAVIEQFRPSLEGKGVELITDLQAGEPFSFDPDAVEQVVANLLSNVEKYAASGGRVDIITGRQGDRAMVRVCDLGPGVPRGMEEAVFEPFVRVHDQLTEGVSGTGIGLSISRELARLHGGELELVPCARGACFELTLPTQ
jgi:signal transduction histidine kinase